MKKTISFFEIFILVLGIVAVAYLVGEVVMVSADDGSDGSDDGSGGDSGDGSGGGLWTCLEDNEGSFCQEYASTECDSHCVTSCLPTERDNTLECQTGNCYDPVEGSCTTNTPKNLCENSGGTWDVEDIAECNLGCCLLGDNAQYVTEQHCQVLSSRTGIDEFEFEPAGNELECLAMAHPDVLGACVLGEVPGEGGKKDCKFITSESCAVLAGDFHEGLLCSNPALNTVCDKQDSSNCVEGKDEIYWFDSCGNRENIYDTNKVRSYNDGKVQSKAESCSLKRGGDFLGNQESCGNCNYLLGSKCGAKTADEKLTDSSQDYVCRDLNCVDEWGNARKQGESWCSFDGKIGVEGKGNGMRSVDVPGSSHYRKVCLDGEVRTETCASGRRSICVENRNDEVGFSSAACRLNQWQRCSEITKDYFDSADNEGNLDERILEKCEEISDCYIKNVEISEKFKFSMCAPRYPPGFDLRSDASGRVAEGICATGTQKCTYVKVKGFFGSKKINEACTRPEFTETMNNLCMSLGDCGGQVNVLGEYNDDGYRVSNAPELSSTYTNLLKGFAGTRQGQFAQGLSEAEVAGLFGYDVSDPNYKTSNLGESFGQIGLGVTGIVQLMSHFGDGGVSLASMGLNNPTLAAFGNGVAAGAMGAGIGYIIGKAFGLKGDALLAATVVGAVTGVVASLVAGSAAASAAAATIASGAAFGASIGSALGTMSGLGIVGANIGSAVGSSIGASVAAGQVSAAPIFLINPAVILVVVAVVLVTVLVMKFLGIGKSKTTTVEFQCLPWQPPNGGNDCKKCGEDGLPCTLYKCESLGQTCELINEGTSDEACIDISPNDVSAPIISPNEDALLPDYEYVSVGRRGFSVRGPTSDGCLSVYSPISFGISLDEPGQCKIDRVHTENYEEMEQFFGASALYKTNHSMPFVLPSLDILQDAGIKFDERADFNLFVRCKDKSGNSNVREYAINFCLSPQDDTTAPMINLISPLPGAFLAWNATSQNVGFYTNEPAECKWGPEDKGYDEMENEISCLNEFEDGTLFGYGCGMTLAIEENETEIYIKCKDQPWLEVSNPDGKTRNVNAEGYDYILKRSADPLEIVSMSPMNETVVSGTFPVSVEMIVETSGGAPGSGRYCEYKWGDNYLRFMESSTDTHRQEFNSLWESKNYIIPIKCQDEVGNSARATMNFTIEVDDVGPVITRFYGSGGTLNIITDEDSECAYDLNGAGFVFTNGTLMTGSGIVHTSDYDIGSIYYVKCKDGFGNLGATLAIGGGYF